MAGQEFKYGDRVVHAARPEWGTGVVTGVQNVAEAGVPSQRLTLRFDRAGLKTISTAQAEIRPASEADVVAEPEAPVNGEAGWLQSLERLSPLELMTRMPEAASDPFASMASRLKATFDLYRFSNQGSSLLDWAAMQTGLRDPLTKFTRQELEQFFHRFALERDGMLKKNLLDAKKSDEPQVREMLANPPVTVKDALRRANLGR
ncbi:MAG TPA: DUF3553 domain-containing protein [Phycisphaerales bacterium]|nr:DUF3553 domain-containing protein [Phycisphaerales bacterium]